jgi:hypothetical protein
MATYLENKATYSRLLSGDGTVLTDSSGALDVHTGFKTHVTSTILSTIGISGGASTDTGELDFGAIGGPPDNVLVYTTNSASQTTKITPSTSYDGVNWFIHTAGSETASNSFVTSANSLLGGHDRYLRFKVSNTGMSDSNYKVDVGYYV